MPTKEHLVDDYDVFIVLQCILIKKKKKLVIKSYWNLDCVEGFAILLSHKRFRSGTANLLYKDLRVNDNKEKYHLRVL